MVGRCISEFEKSFPVFGCSLHCCGTWQVSIHPNLLTTTSFTHHFTFIIARRYHHLLFFHLTSLQHPPSSLQPQLAPLQHCRSPLQQVIGEAISTYQPIPSSIENQSANESVASGSPCRRHPITAPMSLLSQSWAR